MKNVFMVMNSVILGISDHLSTSIQIQSLIPSFKYLIPIKSVFQVNFFINSKNTVRFKK
jgi:hypothetical protein